MLHRTQGLTWAKGEEGGRNCHAISLYGSPCVGRCTPWRGQNSKAYDSERLTGHAHVEYGQPLRFESCTVDGKRSMRPFRPCELNCQRLGNRNRAICKTWHRLSAVPSTSYTGTTDTILLATTSGRSVRKKQEKTI